MNVWYSAVIRADGDEIFIGARSNIQDAAVLHCDSGSPIHLGENVVVGHGAIVHSCTVGDNSLIGMGATLLSGCKIGSGCIVGAGAVVAGNMTVPDNAMVVGLPGKVLKPTTEEQRAYTVADAKHYVELAKKQLEAVGEE